MVYDKTVAFYASNHVVAAILSFSIDLMEVSRENKDGRFDHRFVLVVAVVIVLAVTS